MKNIVVMGCSFMVSSDTGAVGGATCSVTSSPSQAVKADNKFAYFGSMTVSVSGAMLTLPSPPPGASSPTSTPMSWSTTIDGSAENVFSPAGAGAKPALLEGDYGETEVTFQFTPSMGTTPVPVTVMCKVTISGAGQSKVTAS